MDNANNNITKDQLDELGAASINITLVRCMQAGRSFLTGQDFRASQIIMKTLQALGPCADITRHSAPQTLGTLGEVQAFGAVEKALAAVQDVDPTIKGVERVREPVGNEPTPAGARDVLSRMPSVRPPVIYGSNAPEIPTILQEDDVVRNLVAATSDAATDDVAAGPGLNRAIAAARAVDAHDREEMRRGRGIGGGYARDTTDQQDEIREVSIVGTPKVDANITSVPQAGE